MAQKARLALNTSARAVAGGAAAAALTAVCVTALWSPPAVARQAEPAAGTDPAPSSPVTASGATTRG